MALKTTQTTEPIIPKGTKPEQLLRQIHSAEGKVADHITRFAGSMYFVYLHIIIIFVFFVFRPFEEQIFNIALSIEAIFLATFIMISQNRQALVDTYRELEDDQEQRVEEKEQDELEEEVEDIQKDLDDIKNAISFIQQKVTGIEKTTPTRGSGNGSSSTQR